MESKARYLIALIASTMPQTARHWIYRRFLHYRIAATAYIGRSVVSVERLTMESGARIGHLTVIKGCDSVFLGEAATIGHLNWITAPPLSPVAVSMGQEREPSLVLHDHAAITQRHIIDCSDRVTVGKFSTIAGYRNQILTHTIDLVRGRQSTAAVDIGAYCFVGTSTVILPGSRLPDHSVLAAGSLLRSGFTESYALYGGVPAKRLAAIPVDAGYFTRAVGFVE